LALDLLSQGLVADSLTMNLGYAKSAGGAWVRGTATLGRTGATNSARAIREATVALYDDIALYDKPLRRIGLSMNRVREEVCLQYSFFEDPAELERERARQRAILYIRDRYGKNAIFQGMDLLDGARTLERNAQIGGHRA
ncbi:MAG: DNA repair protein, partial [Clostridia bacterium]|nr:DNA repair protein [Clostridia bacterium]